MSWNDDGTLTILRRRQVEQCTGLSRSTIYKRMRDGTFPPAIALGGRMVGWRAADIERFLSNPARYRAPRTGDAQARGDDNEVR
ncbi:helix-turn-helix transcriptional regulator [Burkholderia ambifaria]|uniref:helix-turn-helix transcriptional regulator n=1 Tax=Burkholderia ambifaria TaxID=152480 RepID=UPI0005BC2F86|nr:AlpA family phage regulatory protein [Burkholderia ambifaria]